jgi:hypothetical protein
LSPVLDVLYGFVGFKVPSAAEVNERVEAGNATTAPV